MKTSWTYRVVDHDRRYGSALDLPWETQPIPAGCMVELRSPGSAKGIAHWSSTRWPRAGRLEGKQAQ